MDNESLNKQYAYEALQKYFEATLINELMPGILHNFANPLNGIMGRSKLLQRRMEEYFKIPISSEMIKNEMINQQEKLSKDVTSICNESERFFQMFQDLSSKFYAISNNTIGQINLTKLIETEINFFNFFLDFKHDIKKDVNLKSSLPYVYGVPSYFSLCFFAIIKNMLTRVKRSIKKEFSIETDNSDDFIWMIIMDTGENIYNIPVHENCNKDIPGYDLSSLDFVKIIFESYDVMFDYEPWSGGNRFIIKFPLT